MKHSNFELHRSTPIYHRLPSVFSLAFFAPIFAPILALVLATTSLGCTPTVKVATDEPITINLNVNIKHEILVKVDKDLDSLFGNNKELF